MNYLEEHYFEKLSLKQLAKIGNTNPKTLTRHFLKYRNITPMKYLTNLRIEKAKSLLLQTPYRINEIAFAVGFQDSLYFSTAFHKITGMSPKSFRDK